MSKFIDEDSNIKEKIDYIGLNFQKIPKFLTNFEPLEYGNFSSNDDNEHKIFKFVSIKDIQIIISPTNRLNDIKEKYSLAKPITEYLDPNNLEEYATFLKMLNLASVEEIEKIEKLQEEFNEEIPFCVQYDKDYSWQIYYSEATKKYFMLVTSEDYEFNAFFYLLKEQIKYHKSRKKIDKKIYVPINCVNYSESFLTKSEISDLENYLWLFTKNWPNIYEITNKDDNMYLEIVGVTNVYESIKSGYKITLESKDSAIKYYKGLKALFILQTELNFHYKFDTKINDNCELELYHNLEKIDYNNIIEFVNNEYTRISEEISKEKENKIQLEDRLEELKQLAALKDLEYISKQKEIAMYLKYKKTFFGKIKLFLKFKKKKGNTSKDGNNNVENEEKVEDKLAENLENEEIINNKEKHTIEDLIILYAKLEKETAYIKNMNSDIYALELKLKNVEKKIENATKYIEEIDNHKKSIFEFWKFVNKDELLAMEEGTMKDDSDHISNLKRVFDYELDLTELGIQMDKLQRKTFTKEVQDSIFLLDSDLKDCINMIKLNSDIDFEKLRDKLNDLKKQAEMKKKHYNNEEFDIFGSVEDSQNKVKTLANKKHREAEKDILNILNISKNTDVEELKIRLENAEKMISQAIGQVKSNYNMPVYIALSNSDMIGKEEYGIYHIIPETALKSSEKILSDKINLYKLNIVEGMPLIYFSNIIYYNNFNETLPLGMNVTDKVLIDAAKFKFIPKNMYTFKICDKLKENLIRKKPLVKTIMLCEYELILNEKQINKGENKEND